MRISDWSSDVCSSDLHQVETGLPSRIALYDAMIGVIEGASAGNRAAEVAYASTVGGLKNGLKRARGELDGMQRSDAVAVRRADEAAMLAWLDRQPGDDALEADIAAAQAPIGRASGRERRCKYVKLSVGG